MKFIVLLLMLYCHKIEDFNLQGILASFKQKKWWEDNCPDKKYKNDWIISLIIHSVSWSIAIILPIFLYGYINNIINNKFGLLCIACVVINSVFHVIIDDLKANKNMISLVCDQMIHILQIVITWFVILFI